MDAVGVEGREGRFRWIFAAQIESDLAALVLHREFAAGGI